MVFYCLSFGIDGIDGFKVDVEATSTLGLPQIEIVGLPDTAVKESKNRVKSALKNSGVTLPSSHITINLAPADIKKEGSHYDLPIAAAMMQLSGYLNKNISDTAFIGELSLGGEIRRVNGVLPMVITAREMGVKRIFVPLQNAGEAAVVDGIDVFCAKNLIELKQILNGEIVSFRRK
jgi:magnesium chelatase family protein